MFLVLQTKRRRGETSDGVEEEKRVMQEKERPNQRKGSTGE